MNRRIRRGISCGVPVFPPGPPVTVVVDGRRAPQYARAFVVNGRVYATASLVGSLADRMWIAGRMLVVQRDGRHVRIAVTTGWRTVPEATYVAIGPLLRALGDGVYFRSEARVLEVRTPRVTPIATPTPYVQSPIAPRVRAVFTPEPVPTPRPVWTGSPQPRRTPLPYPPRLIRAAAMR